MSNATSGPIYENLPVFNHHHGRPASWPGLRVEGLARRPATFTADALAALTRQTLVDDFRCEEGWTAPNQQWEGVPLTALLDLAGPLPNARYAAIAADDFTVVVPLADAAGVLLATRLNGADLPPEHGGPCRLVSAGQACYASVKWVDSIRLSAERPAETARDIARARGAGAAAGVSPPAP